MPFGPEEGTSAMDEARYHAPLRRRPGEPLPSGSEWRFDLIERYDREIARVAESYSLDTYPTRSRSSAPSR